MVAAFKNVQKSFGSKKAVNDLSFEIKKGELLALLGPNGAGKSTSVSLLLGLRKPDAGEVQVFGKNPRDPSVRQRLGVIPQELSFPSLLTVKELVHFVRSHYEKPMDLGGVIEALDLKRLMHQKTGGLSGGEKRRLALALALAGDPELLILDEPTTGMDIESRRALWKLIEQLVAQKKTIILTTHYLEEVEALAHRVMVIDQGTAIFDGTVEAIKKKVDLRKISFQCGEDLTILFKNSNVQVSWQKNGDRYLVMTLDSDQWVKTLVEKQVAFSNLSVELASLEEAFLTLQGRNE